MSARKNTEIRTLIVAAKIVSTLFRPIYYPVLCWMILFTLTPLYIFPNVYKMCQLGILIISTVVLPLLFTYVYRSVRHIPAVDMRKQHNRHVPYFMFILCYAGYLIFMSHNNMPYILLSVIIVALLIQLVCTLLNFVWKVSVHAAGAGAIIGAIAAYSELFLFNPLFWLCIAFIVAGMVGTSRMILRQHNLSQIVVGTLIGMLCGFFGILKGYLILLL